MALKPRSPSLTPLKIATPSAHMVSPYVAFSTLQPPKILPEALRNAAPTRKLEYGACAFSLACLAASIRKSFSVTLNLQAYSLQCGWSGGRFCNSGQHRLQQRHEITLYTRRRLQNLPMIQRLIQNPRRSIGNTRNSQHPHLRVSRRYHFRHSGHAHQVGSDRPQISDFRWRFITRSGKRSVNSFINSDTQTVSLSHRNFAKSFVVSRRHVRKPLPEPFIVESRQGVHALQIKVVANHHQTPLRELNSARRIGENHRFHSHACKHPDRE